MQSKIHKLRQAMTDLQFLAPFFAQKRILLLVSASVSLYKMLDVLSTLTKLGAQVKVAMSKESTKLINIHRAGVTPIRQTT